MWLKPLDFGKVKKKILQLIRNAKSLKMKVALYILLIQLLNGTRLSESMEAYGKFVELGCREVQVRVRKRKKKVYRLVIIPKEVERVNVTVSKRYVKYVCNKMLKTNTHSLRYCYITYLAKINIPYQIVAKITKHANPQMIQHYTDELLAMEIQKKIAK